MSKRFVGMCLAHVLHGERVRLRVRASAHVGDGLVRVRGLFGSDTAAAVAVAAVRGAAGAAADAEDPEEAGGEGEADC